MSESTSMPGHQVAVTPSDSANIPGIGPGGANLHIGDGGDGDIKYLTAGGETITLTGVSGEYDVRVRVVRVFATDTTIAHANANILASWTDADG